MRIADLFCGAGGAGMGLSRAGFEVVGFDIEPQPHYPFEFRQADALTVDLSEFDAVWASPPCQMYSIMRNLPWLKDREYWDSVPPTREHLVASGLPYIIENVVGAPLQNYTMLCGGMFGLPLYRHRWFETTFFVSLPGGHPKHRTVISPGRMLGGRERKSQYKMQERPDGIRYGFDRPGSAIGHGVGTEKARVDMGIDWMNRHELSQAIPPAYSEYLGKALLA